MEILIAVVAITFARHDGVLTPGIDANGNPVRAVEFMQSHGLEGNVLAQYGWGQYVIWHGAPGMKVFIDSRYDLAYPPAVVWDWLKLANNLDGGAHTLAAYPHDFVLLSKDSAAIKVMDSQRDWRLIYSDDTARLYAPANSLCRAPRRCAVRRHVAAGIFPIVAMTAGPARVSLWRYSPAIILFAIVIADMRQLSDADLWVHILSGRELLAHGSLPPTNIYSYSAPTFRWLHHEWLSEVILSSLFDRFGPFGLKLLKFICTAGTISFIVLAESETGAPAGVQATILVVAAVILMPSMQFRPQLFDFLALSAIVAMLCRHNWRGSAPLWIAIPIVAIWSNLHGGFFIGLDRDGRLRSGDPTARHLYGSRSASRAGHFCDHRRRCRIYLVHIFDPARARNLVHAHLLDSEPDDGRHHHRLETSDRLDDDRARAAASRRNISSWCFSFLAPQSRP